MMCFTAFCHSIFFRRSPGDRVAVRQVGSRSSMGETCVVSAKVTMVTTLGDLICWCQIRRRRQPGDIDVKKVCGQLTFIVLTYIHMQSILYLQVWWTSYGLEEDYLILGLEITTSLWKKVRYLLLLCYIANFDLISVYALMHHLHIVLSTNKY